MSKRLNEQQNSRNTNTSRLNTSPGNISQLSLNKIDSSQGLFDRRHSGNIKNQNSPKMTEYHKKYISDKLKMQNHSARVCLTSRTHGSRNTGVVQSQTTKAMVNSKLMREQKAPLKSRNSPIQNSLSLNYDLANLSYQQRISDKEEIKELNNSNRNVQLQGYSSQSKIATTNDMAKNIIVTQIQKSQENKQRLTNNMRNKIIAAKTKVMPEMQSISLSSRAHYYGQFYKAREEVISCRTQGSSKKIQNQSYKQVDQAGPKLSTSSSTTELQSTGEGSCLVQNLPESKIKNKNLLAPTKGNKKVHEYQATGFITARDNPTKNIFGETEVTLPSKAFEMRRQSAQQFGLQLNKIKQITENISDDEAEITESLNSNREVISQQSKHNEQAANKDKFQKKANRFFWEAAECGNIHAVQDALSRTKHGDTHADVNCRGQDGWSTLHLAANDGYLKIAKILLDQGVEVDSQSKSNGRTALHIAAMRGKTEIVKELINYGASIDIQDSDGNTPIHLASMEAHTDIIQLLLKLNAQVNITNKQGNLPFGMNTQKGVLSVFEKFINSAHEKILRSKSEKVQNYLRDNHMVSETGISSNTTQQAAVAGCNRSKQIKIQDSYIGADKDFVTPSSPKGIAGPGEDKRKHKKQLDDGVAPTYMKIDGDNTILHPLNPMNLLQSEQSTYNNTIGSSKHDKYSLSSGLGSGSKTISSNQEDEQIGPSSFFPIQLLGKGSFGEVYLVQKKSNSKLYAMKILQKAKIMGQNLTKYAKTERNVLSYTTHPFIVGLHYAFQTREKLFLILDYCPGGDLGHVLQREKKFSESRARFYLAEIILALEDLHSRDIIFRDLKPDNVVLDYKGHALLTDFGLSKEGVLDNKQAKSFCGSVAYLAPEMLKRCGHGKSVDWYLLGVLFYEMLIGVPPYFSTDKDQLFYNIEKGVLKIPSTLSDQAKSLLISLLNRNPHRRLGAGPGDSEEIKHHPFFHGLDWQKAIERRLPVPEPHTKPIIPQDISQKIFEDSQSHQQREEKKIDNVEGWSFINAQK